MASAALDGTSLDRRKLLRPLYILTVLLGSFLLFLIQPMFARMILPLLGGSPSVWNVAMLFYQATLLLGYLYAHALQRLPLRTQLILHVGLLAAASLTLPVAAALWFPPAAQTPPALWLLGLLAASIGPVFFITSAQAPLMQAWFARSRDPAAASPFFLYAASNIGSFAALFAYPVLLEPNARLATQAALWSAGFFALIALVALAGLGVLRTGEHASTAAAAVPDLSVTWRRRARWTLLAAIPSGLLLSTTTHLTTDVMAMPLLWVIPLGTYLLTFIIAFSGGGERATRVAVPAAPLLLVLLGALSTFPSATGTVPLTALASLLLLFTLALALHGLLARDRPAAAALTDFYLWISVGGVLGGLFCALIAPVVFDWVYEHPILLIAAAATIPATSPSPRLDALWQGARSGLAMRFGVPLLTLIIGLLVAMHAGGEGMVTRAGLGLMMLFALVSIGHRRRFVFQLVMLFLAIGGFDQLTTSATPGARVRSFFGIYRVTTKPALQVREFVHGTTLHGLQSLRPELRLRPSTYYAPDSGSGLIFGAAPKLFGPRARVGFLGLGAGTLACYARPGQDWTAFEIDPAVVRIAENPKQFSYIAGCKPDLKIVVGDARLQLARFAPDSFDLLAVDVFSSDAPPMHLMTTQAFALYTRVLAPGGVLLVHVTNRFLDYEPMVAALAAARGWTAQIRHFEPNATELGKGDAHSEWVVLTATPERMAQVLAAQPATAGGWRNLRAEAATSAWTDDHASVLPIVRMFR